MVNNYIYKLTLLETGEYYIGVRSCDCNPVEDLYMGSITAWKVDKSKLTKEIIESNFNTRKLANEYERSLIKENIDNPLNRNYHVPGEGFCTTGKRLTRKHKEKISNSLKGVAGQPRTEAEKLHLSKMHRGKIVSDETKVKMSKAQIGHLVTEETKQKIREKHLGKVMSKESRLKMSKAKMGKKRGKIKWMNEE